MRSVRGRGGSACARGEFLDADDTCSQNHLRASKKFSELIYLYNGKRMHGKALELLRQ